MAFFEDPGVAKNSVRVISHWSDYLYRPKSDRRLEIDVVVVGNGHKNVHIE